MIKKFKCEVPNCKNYFLIKREIIVIVDKSIAFIPNGEYMLLKFTACKKCFHKYGNVEIIRILKDEFESIEKYLGRIWVGY